MVYFYLSPSGVIKRAWGIPYETNGRIRFLELAW